MMETTEECNADEKTSNECGGGETEGCEAQRRETGDTGGGGEASDGSFCCVRSSTDWLGILCSGWCGAL